ncbi:MAG: serine/threonine protein kinase [Labilithrix sp.]|nr:serine/threonine protein kinase [Labilithrix sp.]MCW5814386.1 serine/threonine protein kinase [Labilithrix sp.]
MKARHSFPPGHTSAARLKALLACLESEKGAAAAEAWLGKLRLARNDLEDETRNLPLVALRSALDAFVERVPDGIEKSATFLAARDNLGGWARMLRGIRAPEEAFARMDAGESEHGRTTRWETLESRPGYWKGRVHLTHDPALEEDGLLAQARAVELSVVPTLFGYPRGEVRTLEKSDEKQDFEVSWRVPSPKRGAIMGLVGGGVAGAAVYGVNPAPASLGALALAPLVSAGVLAFLQSKEARRIESAAQTIRVSALERSLALREKASRGGSGDLEGTVIAGQFRIGARMGSGASGVIYEATRLADGMPVAIKLLRAATAHDVTASDRLRRESEALGLSWHPNVVEVIDHGHLADGTSYLVMELLRGEMLATRLKYRVRLTPKELLPIAKQVCEALVAIHAAGVVHRDLKPSNIYLVPDPEEGPDAERVKVFDFGIARVEWEEMRITNIGAPLGTPGYMSPEQETGGEIDARSDLYAAGAVFYECLVGEPPPIDASDMWTPGTRPPSSFAIRLAEEAAIRADSGVQRASSRMPSAAPAAAAVPVDAPPEWRTIIERALAKRANDRFQDARSLLAAIKALDPTSIRPASDRSGT